MTADRILSSIRRLRTLPLAGLALASLLIASACEDNDPLRTDRCAVGEARECTCPNGSKSTQTCSAPNTFGVCVCENVTLPDGGGGTGAGASGASGGGAGGSGGMAGDDDSGMAVAGTTGGAGEMGSDAGVDASVAMTPDPWGPCTKAEDCAPGDKCTMNGTKSYCAKPCTTMNDCPAVPAGSTSTNTCVAPSVGASMICALTCTLGQTCPAGMACTGTVGGLVATCTTM
jgi:hypothetical protein